MPHETIFPTSDYTREIQGIRTDETTRKRSGIDPITPLSDEFFIFDLHKIFFFILRITPENRCSPLSWRAFHGKNNLRNNRHPFGTRSILGFSSKAFSRSFGSYSQDLPEFFIREVISPALP